MIGSWKFKKRAGQSVQFGMFCIAPGLIDPGLGFVASSPNSNTRSAGYWARETVVPLRNVRCDLRLLVHRRNTQDDLRLVYAADSRDPIHKVRRATVFISLGIQNPRD